MNEIIKKINDKLIPSLWYEQLRIFLESCDFSNIIVELKKKVEVDKQRFCPTISKAFKFLESVSFDTIKTVILIDYSCNKLDQGEGVPLLSLNKNYDPEQVLILNSIKKARIDVNSLLKQGVLFVPLSLTSRVGGKSHKKLWSPLLMRIIEVINKRYSKVPWVLIGADTFKYEEDIVSPYVRKVKLVDPMIDKNWTTWINEILTSQNEIAIKW